ncbi:ICE2-domain-containing protein [Pseudovirgaria hyperparasitica]|uniref:ICE2-domain-containing protein n=1 Tax=Pseudovirgaria hyperparasitica TaxID=470096 RepID=A0A6A6W9V8_9PEZI|nr:ICE2-domain-containing protein [Pseudovirgaria hyperparasitica]KAF2759463.1 ICE2-domain-containing protein [Pseudovirgaria hyperparasitica]
MWLTRAISSISFLSTIVFTIPLAFDVGGRTCGLAFSLSLAYFYLFFSILKLSTPDTSRFRYALVQLVAFFQWLIIPTLMIWCLNKFSVDGDGSNWVEKTFGGKRAEPSGIYEWIFGRGGFLENSFIGSWDKVLRWSTPVFQIAEGFCTVLVIQACGQITRWLVNRERGDTWMIGLLVFSASVISSSVYFLWRITKFPEISNVDAILIGAAVTCAIFLCSWGIGSGRGNPVESSLLFAYVVLCIYQIFTDYMPSEANQEQSSQPAQPALPPLPPIIMASYTTLIQAFSTLPSTMHLAFNFVVAATMTITPSVIISLAYRVFVLYSAVRIIPVIRESGARALSEEPSLDDSDDVARILGFASYFSPSILISVYTSLLMQHFASSSNEFGAQDWWTSQAGDTGGNLWRWINLAATMTWYAIELYISKEDATHHWKSD